MAITKILRRKSRVDKLIAYALNPAKTENGSLTAHIHCSDGYAAQEMQSVRKNWDAEQGTQAFHIIQSFAPGEITPEMALRLAQEFAQEHLKGYQVVIGTHCDHAHIHNHIVFNAVSFVDGKKYHSTPQTYYRQVRAISDRLCREHGLSVVMEDGERRRGMSYAEWKAVQDSGLSLRQVVARDIREVLSYALDYGEFLALMEGKGYEIRHGKYLSFRPYGYERFIRPQLDGVKYTEDAIRAHIEGELENPAAQVLVPRAYCPYSRPMVGILGVYRHYLYLLGCVAKHKGPPQQSALLRSELRHFERYKTQHCYLVQHRIVTGEDLQKHQEVLNGQFQALTRTRTILNTQKKRKGKLYTALATVEQFSPVVGLLSEGSIGTEEERCGWKEANELLNGQDVDALKSQKAQLYNQIAEVNRQMRELRKELAMCDTIRTTESALRERMNGFAEKEQGRIQVRSLPDDRDGFPGL